MFWWFPPCPASEDELGRSLGLSLSLTNSSYRAPTVSHCLYFCSHWSCFLVPVQVESRTRWSWQQRAFSAQPKDSTGTLKSSKHQTSFSFCFVRIISCKFFTRVSETFVIYNLDIGEMLHAMHWLMYRSQRGLGQSHSGLNRQSSRMHHYRQVSKSIT